MLRGDAQPGRPPLEALLDYYSSVLNRLWSRIFVLKSQNTSLIFFSLTGLSIAIAVFLGGVQGGVRMAPLEAALALGVAGAYAASLALAFSIFSPQVYAELTVREADYQGYAELSPDEFLAEYLRWTRAALVANVQRYGREVQRHFKAFVLFLCGTAILAAYLAASVAW